MDFFRWWENQSKFPTWRECARRLSTLLSSSASSEEAFSLFTRVCSPIFFHFLLLGCDSQEGQIFARRHARGTHDNALQPSIFPWRFLSACPRSDSLTVSPCIGINFFAARPKYWKILESSRKIKYLLVSVFPVPLDRREQSQTTDT